MQIRNKGTSSSTILIRDVSYTLVPNAVLVLPDRDYVAARRATRIFNDLEIKFASDMAASLSNITATSNPSATDDSSKGYSVGSKWINNITKEEWTCFSAISGSAEWKQGGSGGSGIQTGTSLPLASEIYRGTQFLLLGASQTPDVMFICTKDYQDNYAWNEFVLIGQ